MAGLGGLEPLGLEEYDTPTQTVAEQRDNDRNDHVDNLNEPDATQMEENLGVEDLGVDDVLQTKVRRPLPKLDAKRLLNRHRGYPFLLEHLKKIPYRGKGDEKRYLKKYVNTYLIWANRLWPKANFDDFTVLARKAGRDPQVRQYCRELIEEEKYGGQRLNDSPTQDDPFSSSLDLHASNRPNREVSFHSTQEHDTLQSDTQHTNEEDEQNHDAQANNAQTNDAQTNDAQNERSPPNEALSPPPEELEWEHHEQDAADSVPDVVGPNEDEEAAAMELYGDLGM